MTENTKCTEISYEELYISGKRVTKGYRVAIGKVKWIESDFTRLANSIKSHYPNGSGIPIRTIKEKSLRVFQKEAILNRPIKTSRLAKLARMMSKNYSEN